MKKKKVTDEELEKLKQIREENKAIQESILFETEALTKKQEKERNIEKEKEVRELIGGGVFSVALVKDLNRILLKEAGPYRKLFIEAFYDVFRKLTGLKKSEKYPHYKPSIFAVYTLLYVYRRFKIKNLIKELQGRNPFITGQFIRYNKHFQYFKTEEDREKLIGFMYDVINVGNGSDCKTMLDFHAIYCTKYGLPMNGDLF